MKLSPRNAFKVKEHMQRCGAVGGMLKGKQAMGKAPMNGSPQCGAMQLLTVCLQTTQLKKKLPPHHNWWH